MDEDCVILDLPEGLRLDLLGLIVAIDEPAGGGPAPA